MSRRNLLSENELKLLSKQQFVTDDETALRLFYEDCELRGLRPDTFRYYREVLKPFNKPICQMTETDVKSMILNFQERGLKTSTINTKLRGYRAFFNFLYKNKHIKFNPMANVKMMKERKAVVETLTKEQIELLLSLCDLRTFVGLRDKTMLMLLIDTGIRLNEMANLEVNDVKTDTILIKQAKGYFQREVPISKKMKEQFDIYLKIRGELDTTALFVTQDNTPLKRRSFQNRIEHYAVLSEIENVRVSAHTFRHSFAKNFIINGGGAFQLQQILGHTSLEVTKIYVNLWGQDLKSAHDKYGYFK